MNKKRIVYLLTSCLIFLFIFGCSNTNAERSEHDLLSLFQKYHDEKDINKMMGLFYQKNTTKDRIERWKKINERFLTDKILKIKIMPLTEKDTAKLGTLNLNLTPLKGMKVKFGGKHGLTYSSFVIGKAKNTHYFIIF